MNIFFQTEGAQAMRPAGGWHTSHVNMPEQTTARWRCSCPCIASSGILGVVPVGAASRVAGNFERGGLVQGVYVEVGRAPPPSPLVYSGNTNAPAQTQTHTRTHTYTHTHTPLSSSIVMLLGWSTVCRNTLAVSLRCWKLDTRRGKQNAPAW